MRLCPFLGLLALTLAWAPSATAQDQDAVVEIARKHYELGEKLYQASAYAEALEEFKKAYNLVPRPALLFNIARTHEVLGQLPLAIQTYKKYLVEEPDADNRSLVETRIQNLERRIEPKPEPKPRPQPTPATRPVSAAPEPTPLPPPRPAEPRPGRWKRTTAWITLSAGGALVVTGLVLGGLAADKADDYNKNRQDQPYAQVKDELDEIDSSGKSLELGQIVCLVLGGVAVAAGGGLLAWDLLAPRRERAVSLSPVLSPTMAGLSGQVRF